MRVFVIIGFFGLFHMSALSQEEKPFDDYYSSLFDTTLNDSSFLEVLLPFYAALSQKSSLEVNERIGETYESYTVHYEDSLELSSGRAYVFQKKSWDRLQYMGNEIMRHEYLDEFPQDLIEWTVLDSTVEKKLQTPVPVIRDSVHILEEVIYNHPKNMKVSFTLEYQPDFFHVQLSFWTTLSDISHSNKKIVGVRNVRFSAINEED